MKARILVFFVVFFGLFLLRIYSSWMRTAIYDMPIGGGAAQIFIAHGGGKIDGIAQSNSRQAFLRSVSLGYKYIELDLIETADGKFVAAHDWARLREYIFDEKPGSNESLNFSTVAGKMLLGRYNLLGSEDISKLLDENSDIFLVTDQTNNYKKINEIGHVDRIFVETFNIFDYLSALVSGIKRPMLNVNEGRFGMLLSLFGYIVANPKYVTASKMSVEGNDWFFEFLKNHGVYIFIYTVNDGVSAEKYKKKYDAVIYTDDLIN